MAGDTRLPIHFFTIVLNGEPFIRYHLERMKALSCPWHWHVVEGLADLKHDTAWSLSFGASIPADVAKDGRSVDGTAEYLDQIARENPGQITIYRAPNGRMWDGKLEMVAAPLVNLKEECLLWEIDSDELWTTSQFAKLRELFLANPQRTAAVFYCWYFVGPELLIDRRRKYPEIEWRRAWRFRPGMKWAAHEPPILAAPVPGSNQFVDIMRQNPYLPAEMEKQNLVFQHFAYVTEAQLQFKEKYYGYRGITDQWKRLGGQDAFPIRLRSYFNWPWVDPGAMVDRAQACGIRPLAIVGPGGWQLDQAAEKIVDAGPVPSPEIERFPTATAKSERGILFIRNGANDQLLERAIQSVRTFHPELQIHVHQMGRQQPSENIGVWLAASPFDETLFLDSDAAVLDRLDFGFEMAARHGLACCMSECPWARRNGGVQGDLVEYSTGALFFGNNAKKLFTKWAAVEAARPGLRITDPRAQLGVMSPADQTNFSLAVAQCETPPFILPFNWNFQPQWNRSWWGPIKICGDKTDPPEGIISWTQSQAPADAIIQYVSFK